MHCSSAEKFESDRIRGCSAREIVNPQLIFASMTSCIAPGAPATCDWSITFQIAPQGWSDTFWRTDVENASDVDELELLVNMAGNAYSAFHWIPWTCALLSVYGRFMSDGNSRDAAGSSSAGDNSGTVAGVARHSPDRYSDHESREPDSD